MYVDYILTQVQDAESKVKATTQLCDKTQQTTSIGGREVLKREVASLHSDWESLSSEASEVRSGLERALLQWQEFEENHEILTGWLTRCEQSLKGLELKATLEEKQEVTQKLKVGVNYGMCVINTPLNKVIQNHPGISLHFYAAQPNLFHHSERS